MLTPSEICFDDDEEEEMAELLRALPEVRENVDFACRDEELGLRALLDWPNAVPRA